jgi:hypothetical protein
LIWNQILEWKEGMPQSSKAKKLHPSSGVDEDQEKGKMINKNELNN